MGMLELRKDIDDLDDQIIRILDRRMRIVKEIRALKGDAQMEDTAREREILERLKKLELDVEGSFIDDIWKVIFSYAKR